MIRNRRLLDIRRKNINPIKKNIKPIKKNIRVIGGRNYIIRKKNKPFLSRILFKLAEYFRKCGEEWKI